MKTIGENSKSLHNCGNGFKGHIVKARGVSFCGFCGKEFGL